MHQLNALREVAVEEAVADAPHTDLLSMVTHELRSPIAALRLQVASLRRNPATAADPRRLERIARQVERLSILVQNLLDATDAASTGQLSVHLEEDLELGEVIYDALEKLHPEIALRSGVIRVHQAAPIRGTWDRLRVEQIATNLLSNAIKYGHSRPIEVRVEQRGDRAVLAVQDRGAGIDPERLNRLFDRFERFVTDTQKRGVGLGLWIVRNAAEAMGGTVSVETQPGVGSTFTVDLPLYPDAS